MLKSVQSFVDIQVSLGSSVLNFDIINNGYGYDGEILTIPSGGITGIPTDSAVGAGFSDFRINVNNADSDKFSGWRFGDFDVFDKLDPFFDGERQVFTMKGRAHQPLLELQKDLLLKLSKLFWYS